MAVPRQGGPRLQDARVDRILTVAADLLLRWGYKRVTVEEIADRADVGKGTVYLHWNTKDDLFVTLLLREILKLLEELAVLIREHPREVMLHRAFRCVFVYAAQRPLLRAFLGGNLDILGRLGTNCAGMREYRSMAVGIYREYLQSLLRYDLLDLGPDEGATRYALDATVTGFISQWRSWYESDHELAPEIKANAMARALRRAFEPTEPPEPAVAAAARDVTGLLDEHVAGCRSALPCDCPPLPKSGDG